MPKVSIIIPCYNVEKGLIERCIKKILFQSYEDYEIVVIDDGSDKQHASILEEVSILDKRIKLYHQKNMGVSEARNKGMSLATGDYISFVDADDTITNDYLSEAVRIAEHTQADILYGYTYRGIDEVPETNKNQSFHKHRTINNEWLKERYFRTFQPEDNKSFGRGPYARLLKRQLAVSVPFPKGVPIGEDVIWNLELLQYAKNKILVDNIWYNYIISEESVTRRYTPNIQEKLAPFYSKIDTYLCNTNTDKALYISRVAYDYTNYVLGLFIGNRNHNGSFVQKWKQAIQIGKTKPWRLMNEVYKDKEIYYSLEKGARQKVMLFHLGILFPIWWYKNKGIR